MDERDIILKLAEVERRLEAFVAAGAAAHGRAYAPGKWTGAEVLGHVADSSTVFFYRFLRAAAEGGDIVPFDQEVWARGLNLAARPAAVSLATLRGIHAAVAHHSQVLPSRIASSWPAWCRSWLVSCAAMATGVIGPRSGCFDVRARASGLNVRRKAEAVPY